MEYIETGEIVTVFGIKGEVKVYPWADYPAFLEDFDTFYIKQRNGFMKKLDAVSVRTQKNMVVIAFDGINTVEQARTLVGNVLYLDKDSIPMEEGRYFVADLIGCKVINNETGRVLGTVRDVKNLGSCDIYYIDGTDGKEYLFPAVDEFLMGTDIRAKEIKVKVIEGMFGED